MLAFLMIKSIPASVSFVYNIIIYKREIWGVTVILVRRVHGNLSSNSERWIL